MSKKEGRIAQTQMSREWARAWERAGAGAGSGEGSSKSVRDPNRAMRAILEIGFEHSGLRPSGYAFGLGGSHHSQLTMAIKVVSVAVVSALEDAPGRLYPGAMEAVHRGYESGDLASPGGRAVGADLPWKRVVLVAEMATALTRPARITEWVDQELGAAGIDEPHDLELCWALAPRTMRKVQQQWQGHATASTRPPGSTFDDEQVQRVIDALADSSPIH